MRHGVKSLRESGCRAECVPGRTRAAEGNGRRPIVCTRNRTDPISGFAKMATLRTRRISCFRATPSGPYRGDDEPGPLNLYGETKLGGEQSLTATGADAVILRTSWVYGGTAPTSCALCCGCSTSGGSCASWTIRSTPHLEPDAGQGETAQILSRILGGSLDPARVTMRPTAAERAGATSPALFSISAVVAVDFCPSQPASIRPSPSSGLFGAGQHQAPGDLRPLALPDWEVSLRQCLEDLGSCERR